MEAIPLASSLLASFFSRLLEKKLKSLVWAVDKVLVRYFITLLLSVFCLFASPVGADRKEVREKAREQKRKRELIKRLKNGELEAVNLAGANLEGANLLMANLEGAYLPGANLAGANLEGANLLMANLVGANLEGANLKGAWYDKNTFFPKGFDPKKHGMRTKISFEKWMEWMKKASKKRERNPTKAFSPAAVNSNLKIQGCEGGEMSPDQKIIICPNGRLYRLEDSAPMIMDVLERSLGKESLVMPMEGEYAGKSAIGQ